MLPIRTSCHMLMLILIALLYSTTVISAPDGMERAPLHPQPNASRISGQYIIVLKEGIDVDVFATNFDTSRGQADERSVYRYRNAIKGFSARLTSRSLNELRNNSAVEYIEEDGVVKAYAVSSWGLDRIDQRDLPLDGRTPAFQGHGSGVHIYIIDSGTLKTHDEFSGRLSSEGFDAYGDPVGTDCNGHGTHCGGIAAGSTYGVASQAIIHSVRVLKCDGNGSNSAVITGMDWVAANARYPAVASMSLGGSRSISMNRAVKRLYEAGVVVSVAAGNENMDACLTSPASAPQSITVAATDKRDRRATFSNYGSCVGIFAPGVGIESAWIGSDTSTSTKSGTSMACPHVSGAAAVLLSINGLLTPQHVSEELVALSTVGKVSDEKFSPDRLLYIGGDGDADAVPSPTTTSASVATLRMRNWTGTTTILVFPLMCLTLFHR